MEQIGCEVTNAKEAPFVMSQLLSKLDPKDNIEFGREMHRIEKEENVLNLLDWLNSEASLRSRVRKDADYHNNSGEHRISRKFDNRAMDSETSDDDVCPLGCEAKHLLAACPKYQRSTIDQRWEKSAYGNIIQTFVKSQTDRRATDAVEDIIAHFTMSNLFQPIPV